MNDQMVEEKCSVLAADTTTDSEIPKISLLSSSLVLGLRQVITQGLGIIVGLILTQWLSPEEYGVYAISNFFFFLCLCLGDLGLGASLVRETSEPSVALYRKVMAVRNLLDVLVFSLVWSISFYLAKYYSTGPDGVWLFRALALAALIQSFQIVPTIIMERQLNFARIAAIEVAQSVAQMGLLLFFTYRGYGVITFGASWVAFSITGALLANRLSPWTIGWTWKTPSIRERLAFSLPYQATGAVNLLRDAITPVLIGLLFGSATVGYLSLAQMIALSPTLVLLILARVFFPSFSKFRGDRAELGKLMEQALRLGHSFVAPITTMILVLLHPIVVVVFGTKWIEVIQYVYLLSIASLTVPCIVPAQSLFYALGRSRIVLVFATVTTLVCWSLTLPLVFYYGAQGYVIAYAITQLASVLLLRASRSEATFRFWGLLIPIWLRAIFVGSIIWLLNSSYPATSFLQIVAYGSSGLALFFIVELFASFQTQKHISPVY